MFALSETRAAFFDSVVSDGLDFSKDNSRDRYALSGNVRKALGELWVRVFFSRCI